jgi:DNA-binding NarL/FixJ family response regulator
MAGQLTQRQQEIATLFARGLSERDIATKLGIGRDSVRGHIDAILHRLALADRQHLKEWAGRQGGSQ